jgi:hypothetical protein
MNIRLAGLVLGVCLGCVQATPIPVNFIKAIVPGPIDVSLPFFMDSTSDTVFLRFAIPNPQQIASIDSMTVNVRVYDDGDRVGEAGEILLALIGPNLSLDSFGPNINGTTNAAPFTLSHTLTPDEIAQAQPELLDGFFRIRVQRHAGDFFVEDGDVSMDVTLTPEPASVFTVLMGVGALVSIAVRRKARAQ